MLISRCVAALVLLAGCGESKQSPGEVSKEEVPAVAPTPPAPAVTDAAPPPAATGPTDYTLTDGGVAVTITLTPPDGWKAGDPQPNHVAMNNGDIAAPAWIKILLTCHGACGDAAVLGKNIAKVAVERFDFTKSDGFVPRLAPVWDQKPAAPVDGVVGWAFHGDAVSGEDWNLHQIAIERILETPSGPRVLECIVEATRQPKAVEDQLVKLCADLPVQVGAAPPTPSP
ncbi:MAG TPA: hypothetical protein VMZ28_01560 [Kofleriaceae bacterium]|nr:hypothetical protein [Kofleriaceae bacterium]